MILDGLVVLALNLWDNHLKQQKKNSVVQQNEADKKAFRATKSSSRQQRKQADKKQKHASNGPMSFAPKQHINQPKKST